MSKHNESMFHAKFGQCPKKSSARRFLQTCRIVEKEFVAVATKMAQLKLEKSFGNLVTPKMMAVEIRRQLEKKKQLVVATALKRS